MKGLALGRASGRTWDVVLEVGIFSGAPFHREPKKDVKPPDITESGPRERRMVIQARERRPKERFMADEGERSG